MNTIFRRNHDLSFARDHDADEAGSGSGARSDSCARAATRDGSDCRCPIRQFLRRWKAMSRFSMRAAQLGVRERGHDGDWLAVVFDGVETDRDFTLVPLNRPGKLCT